MSCVSNSQGRFDLHDPMPTDRASQMAWETDAPPGTAGTAPINSVTDSTRRGLSFAVQDATTRARRDTDRMATRMSRAPSCGVHSRRHRRWRCSRILSGSRLPRETRSDAAARRQTGGSRSRAGARGGPGAAASRTARGDVPGPPWRASRRQNTLACEVATDYASPGTGMDTVHLGNVG
jgi:hypothetical protein